MVITIKSTANNKIKEKFLLREISHRVRGQGEEPPTDSTEKPYPFY